MAGVSLPPPILINGLSCIPPPSAKAFGEELAGILPPGKDIQSSRGILHYYGFTSNVSPDAKRVILIHGIGTCTIGMTPLAHRLTASGSHMHVMTYDLWGHGKPSNPLEPHTPALMHAQIFELLSWAK